MRQVHLFFTALMFFTRIPCPKWVDHHPEYLNRSSRYFSLIGWVVGGIGFVVYQLSALAFPVSVSVLLSMAATVWATGAFHEDGFADVCDGFGGGWTKERILEIMKDSRLGTFGVVGLGLLMALKYQMLVLLLGEQKEVLTALGIFLASHALSRANAATLIFTDTYAQADAASKSKPLAQQMYGYEFSIVLLFGLLPLALLLETPEVFLVMLPLFLVRQYCSRFFNKWINGYTGDCLGTVQQVSEVVILMSFVVLWKFF